MDEITSRSDADNNNEWRKGKDKKAIEILTFGANPDFSRSKDQRALRRMEIEGERFVTSRVVRLSLWPLKTPSP